MATMGELRKLLRDRVSRKSANPADMSDRTLDESIGRELVLLRTLFDGRTSGWLRQLEAERESRQS